MIHRPYLGGFLNVELSFPFRTFFHKRAAIEKDYASALQKLTEGILKKKEYPTTPTDLQPDDGDAKYEPARASRVLRHVIKDE